MVHLEGYLKTVGLQKGEYYLVKYYYNKKQKKPETFIGLYKGIGMFGTHSFCSEYSKFSGEREGCAHSYNLIFGSRDEITHIPKDKVVREEIKEDCSCFKDGKCPPGMKRFDIKHYKFAVRKQA